MPMITVREAEQADNPGLLALTRATPMDGRVSIRIDRDPDFFALVRLRGRGKTFVAIVDGRIVACFSVTYRTVFVNAQPRTIGHMGDLKLDPRHRGQRVLFRILRAAFDYMDTQDVNMYACVAARGNERVMSLLRSRLFLPEWRSAGNFRVYQMLPAFFRRRDPAGGRYAIALAGNSEIAAVCDLCNGFNASYQLAPVLDGTALRAPETPPSVQPPCRVFTARHDGAIVATLSALDLANVKQIYVAGVSSPMRFLLRALGAARRFIPRLAVPQMGAPLKALFLRNAAYAPGHGEALRALLAHIRHLAFREGYSLVTIGIHEHDPLGFMVSGVPRYAFQSTLLLATRPGPNIARDPALIDSVLGGIPAEDFSVA
jgi:GNAT superfamily N-acetyltransferase